MGVNQKPKFKKFEPLSLVAENHPPRLSKRKDAKKDGYERDCRRDALSNGNRENRPTDNPGQLKDRKENGDGTEYGSRDGNGLMLSLKVHSGAICCPIHRFDDLLAALEGGGKRPPLRHLLGGVVHIVSRFM